MNREDVTFTSGSETCAAWLYRPAEAEAETETEPETAAVPCVILAHGFAGVREARLDAYAERFAAAGLAALVFDYRHFGASTGEPRQLLDIGRQQEDWRAAIAYARTLPGIDAERIALWGTSFSGGHVAVVAAGDPRVAAVVSQGPFVDGLATLGAAGPANLGRMTVAGLRDEARRVRGRDPFLVAAVGPPGSVAAMTSPDAEPGYRALFGPGQSFVNEVAARVLLRIATYRPITSAAKVRCPWLICVCANDAITPPKPAARAARKGPRAELRRYAGAAHFDVYVGELFERAVADQTEFLTRSLGLEARVVAAAP
jgi:dienelactone hydrolase